MSLQGLPGAAAARSRLLAPAAVVCVHARTLTRCSACCSQASRCVSACCRLLVLCCCGCQCSGLDGMQSACTRARALQRFDSANCKRAQQVGLSTNNFPALTGGTCGVRSLGWVAGAATMRDACSGAARACVRSCCAGLKPHSPGRPGMHTRASRAHHAAVGGGDGSLRCVSSGRQAARSDLLPAQQCYQGWHARRRHASDRAHHSAHGLTVD